MKLTKGESMKTILKLTMICFLGMTIASCAGNSTSESTGQYVDSSVITSKVKTELATSDKVSALEVKVKTYKNTVQLSGFVSTEAEKESAEKIALNVKGVEEVENSIVVK